MDANMRADAQPAANALRTTAIISCPAPFERLEVLWTPTIGNRTTRKPYEDFRPAAPKPRVEEFYRITYGSKPRKRERLMARASSRCFLAETAVMRLGTI